MTGFPGTPGRGLLAAGIPRSSVLLLSALLAVEPCRGDEVGSITVGGIEVNPIKIIDTDTITDKWWFWVVIAITGLFLIVGGYFVWRGWKQWKRHKELEKQQQEEEEAKAASVSVLPLKTDSSSADSKGDMEQGLAPPAAPPATTLSQEETEMQRERERRTAVHPKLRQPAPSSKW